jgi:hypothetical protein
MTWLQVLKFPQSSVDFHVRVMVYSCGQAPAIVASVYVTVGVASQLSEEEGFPVLAGNVLAEQSTVTLAGQVILGALVSTIVINWVQVLELPQSSIALNVLVITICGQSVPLITSEKPIVGVASQLSVAVAFPVAEVAVLALH